MKVLMIIRLLTFIVISTHVLALSGESFTFHGYLRTGIGTNSKGGDHVCFNNPGSNGNEFRLGNECSTYGEMTFVGHHLKGKRPTDPYFRTQITLGYSTNAQTNWDTINGGDGFSLREAYIEGGNLEGTSYSYWVGNRFYRDNDVYMNDFYYFADASANGAGIKGIKLAGAKLDIAYLKHISDQTTDEGKVALSFFDIRLNDIKISQSSSLKFWLGHALTSSGSDENGNLYKNQDGTVFGTLLGTNFNGGFNHFGLILGKGVMEDIQLYFSPLGYNTTEYTVEKNKFRIRAIEHLTFKISPVLEMHTSASYELRDSGAAVNNKEVWYNVGVQPVYYITKHYQLAGVLGHSSVDKQGEEDRRLFRVTIAPQIALSNNIWARPVLRAFYSHSFWSRSNRGKIGGDTYKYETDGGNFGFQAEVFY
jgi:maltoporin